MKARIDTKTLILALTIVSVWGFSFVAIRIALNHLSPWELVGFRFVPALFGFLPLALYKSLPKLRALTVKEWGGLFLLGILGVEGYNLSLNTGQTMIPASLAALVIALNPASIAVFSAIFLRERPPIRTWVGLLVSLIGISIVILGRNHIGSVDWKQVLGVLITIGAPLSWGIYSTGIKSFSKKLGGALPVSVSMIMGSGLLLFTPLWNPEIIQTAGNLPVQAWAAVFFLSVACTIFGFTAWGVVLKRLPASRAGAFIYLVPLVAAFGSRWLLNEPLDLPLILGAAIVLTGVWFSTSPA